MQYIGYSNPKLLIADEDKTIRDINDVYVAEHYDEEGNLVPEHKPYYSSVIFLGEQINSLEECKELYVEEEIEKEYNQS